MRRGSTDGTAPRVRWGWLAVIGLLLVMRLPSLVQPAGGDQGLYGYAGQRILAGDVMYRDVWDQKPPAIAFVYALLWSVWPHESVVPAADLLVAALTAWLLVVLGQRRFSSSIGYGGAAIFLLLGDPYIQRQAGIYVRAQCEPFIALAVTASLTLLAAMERRTVTLVAGGFMFAVAFWLKYNAAAFVLPIVVATVLWRGEQTTVQRSVFRDGLWAAAGFGLVAATVIGYFAVTGALTDLRLATIDYNLAYSQETYAERNPMWYPIRLPVERAALDPLWFAGGLGTLLLVSSAPRDRATGVLLAWLAAAVASIAINGSRGLPNYFVQANPALALAASAGLATLALRAPLLRAVAAAILLVGLWRVGSEPPIPEVVRNARFDLDYARGRLDRDTYLHRFRGGKHDPLEIERLVQQVRDTTHETDPIFVFGFSGGSVSWKSGRRSASRLFWSRPVIIGFAADRAGYGAAGLLDDLRRDRPSLVALQKEEWRSHDYFMQNESLRTWLEAGYTLERESPEFSVWRLKAEARE